MLNGLVTRGRVVHYLEIFAAASIVYAAANYDHILGAHGLNAAKSLAIGAAAAGAKAVLEAWRKATRPAAVPAAIPTLGVSSGNTTNTSWYTIPPAAAAPVPPAVAEAKPLPSAPAAPAAPEQPTPPPA